MSLPQEPFVVSVKFSVSQLPFFQEAFLILIDLQLLLMPSWLFYPEMRTINLYL